jgi:hypothetical protein
MLEICDGGGRDHDGADRQTESHAEFVARGTTTTCSALEYAFSLMGREGGGEGMEDVPRFDMLVQSDLVGDGVEVLLSWV